ncbi:MAG: hypothetical protein ACJ73S_15765 [Mycobacteriales bacterium]|jgi:hypothetical protein
MSLNAPLEPDRWARQQGVPAQVPYGGYGNGLAAEAYAPFLDLDPPRARMLLLSLRRAGVAAYAAPVDRWRRRTQPVARVWVDVATRPVAEDVVRAELPAQPPDRPGPDPLRALLPLLNRAVDLQPAAEELIEAYGAGGGDPRDGAPLEREYRELADTAGAIPAGAADRRLVAAAEILLHHHQRMLREALHLRFSAVPGPPADRRPIAALRRLRDEVANATG